MQKDEQLVTASIISVCTHFKAAQITPASSILCLMHFVNWFDHFCVLSWTTYANVCKSMHRLPWEMRCKHLKFLWNECFQKKKTADYPDCWSWVQEIVQLEKMRNKLMLDFTWQVGFKMKGRIFLLVCFWGHR